tara:strand:+ start:108 stop:470 length:363 start_codon:yes stop_codon:yes gene_type:complete
MKRPKLKLNLHDKDGVLIKHLLPFVNLVCSKSDRDIGIQLLGFHNKQSYMNAFTQDRRYGDMLAIIIFLFMLDEYEERKLFFDKITFDDRALESRLRELCGFDKEDLSVDELNAIWDIPS